jgi:hypothetical protein
MTDDDDTDADERPGPDHYFYSSDGHLWVDMTAIRERSGLSVITQEGSEVVLDFTTARVGKRNPHVCLPLTSEADGRLGDCYGDEGVPDNLEAALPALDSAKQEIRLAQDTINEALDHE